MIRSFSILVLCLGLASCSTLRRSKVYGALLGGFIGTSIGLVVGHELAPPGKTNEVFNTALGGLVGGVVGGGTGYFAGSYFYGENPENQELKQMIQDSRQIDLSKINLGSQSIMIKANMTPVKSYQVPTSEIPESLRKVMKKPVLIEHTVEEQYIKLDNNRTLYVPEFNVTEQTFED